MEVDAAARPKRQRRKAPGTEGPCAPIGVYDLLWEAPLDQLRPDQGVKWARERKFEAAAQRDAALHRIARRVVDGCPRRNVLVAFGHALCGAGGAIRVTTGARFPMKRFRDKVLPIYAEVVVVQEHYSSQMCSRCVNRWLPHALGIRALVDWPPPTRGQRGARVPWHARWPRIAEADLPPPLNAPQQRLEHQRHQLGPGQVSKVVGGASWQTKVGMFCPSCRTICSRDSNAAGNMLIFNVAGQHGGSHDLRPGPTAFNPRA